jgi:ABC-2 type transport system permease protein
MWAVAGSVVSRQEDLGSSSSLVMTLVMVPYFMVIFLQDNALAMTVLSYLPFSAAVAMPARLFTGDALMWEPALSLTMVLVTAVACVLVGARLYEGALLQTGARVKLANAWSRDST